MMNLVTIALEPKNDSITDATSGAVPLIWTYIFYFIILCLTVSVITLTIRAILKFTKSKEVRNEKSAIKKSLGEVIKEHRTRCQMTQEFLAESLGVSRQAVSKWENGTSDPSTSNLIAIAKLFGISAEDFLKEISDK